MYKIIAGLMTLSLIPITAFAFFLKPDDFNSEIGFVPRVTKLPETEVLGVIDSPIDYNTKINNLEDFSIFSVSSTSSSSAMVKSQKQDKDLPVISPRPAQSSSKSSVVSSDNNDNNCYETGLASWVDYTKYPGYDTYAAAHNNIPKGSKVRVYRLKDGQKTSYVDVIIQDKGPFIEGRIIDISKAAAKEINMVSAGIAQVCIIRL